MTDVAPFRERPKFLLCPRCGEMLERAFEAVLTCLRCEGLWIAAVTLERTFGDPRWPRGPSMWWRNELECPECASEGQVQAMTAVQAGDIVVDRCSSHGVWLDRTELCRLMGSGDPGPGGVSPDLAALRARLEATDVDLEQLARRRDAWRTDLGARRKAAQEYRAWLEAEQRRRLEGSAALERAERERLREREREREQAQAEQARAEQARESAAEARAREARAEAERERKREIEEREAERAAARRERARAIQRLGDTRMAASADIERLETRIIMLREQLHATEAELDGARVRLRAIDDQLDAAQAQPG
jgi:Zn-finger nucleic acid-binding protein